MKGWVYVISNEGKPGIVKVGYSTKDPEIRAKDLDSTADPYPHLVDYEVIVEDPYGLEQRSHKALRGSRISDEGVGTEWFKTTAENAVYEIRSIAGDKILFEDFKRAKREEILRREEEELEKEKKVEEERLEKLRLKKEEEERLRREEEEHLRREEEERLQKEGRERVRREEKERLEKLRLQKEEEERIRREEEERLEKLHLQKKKEERIRREKENHIRREEEERLEKLHLQKKKEERIRLEKEDQIRREAKAIIEKRHLEETSDERADQRHSKIAKAECLNKFNKLKLNLVIECRELHKVAGHSPVNEKEVERHIKNLRKKFDDEFSTPLITEGVLSTKVLYFRKKMMDDIAAQYFLSGQKKSEIEAKMDYPSDAHGLEWGDLISAQEMEGQNIKLRLQSEKKRKQREQDEQSRKSPLQKKEDARIQREEDALIKKYLTQKEGTTSL